MASIARRLTAATVGMVALAAAAPASADPALAQVDAIFARWSGKDAPGCAVAVSRDGKAIAMRAYGMADLEHAIPATVDSIYEAGSDSKQFTAAALLMLARDGKLSLDDDVRKYLPELPDYGATITLRQMLHHVSGLRDWGSLGALEGWPRNSRTANNDDVLKLVAQQKELNFAPGTHYLYSNSNYNLAAIVVARVSGQSLADFTRDRIFKPLGMTQTSWRDDYHRLVVGRTGAYEASAAGYRNEQVIEDAYGNGGLLTTVGDLVKWQAALDSDFFGKGFVAEMERPFVLAGGIRMAYGLALVGGDHNGVFEVSHSGSTGGYRAWMARYPAQKLAVSLLCNTGEADTPTLGRQVADLYLPAFRAKSYAPRGALPTGVWVDRLTGFPYRFAADGKGGMTVNGRALVPVGPGRWQLREDVFAFSGSALVRETREGERQPFDHVAAPVADLAPYAGRYCSDEVASCITVKVDGARLVFSGPRWSGQPLEPAYRDVFTGDAGALESSFVLKFQRDAAGGVAALRVGETRAFNLLFRRTG
ncbi:serine hydrolase [uncultured Sphingomonas sp.]|uniref:serine hydrolase domain-containing protein n=1 Tax=uncultured Sphingomonas sp. TaxID=158754 RepID=UPI002603CC43|nr:serine hydrolase domain-containing protein [uncultured Sphingomonas sp.]